MAAAIEEGFPSGQRDQTVNLTAPPSKVRILLPPPFAYNLKDTKVKSWRGSRVAKGIRL